MPTMNCPTSDTTGTIEGIGNEQSVGTPTLLAGVWTACVGGTPTELLEALAGGGEQQGAVAPGDRVNILVTQTATNLAPEPAPYASGAHPYLCVGEAIEDLELTVPVQGSARLQLSRGTAVVLGTGGAAVVPPPPTTVLDGCTRCAAH